MYVVQVVEIWLCIVVYVGVVYVWKYGLVGCVFWFDGVEIVVVCNDSGNIDGYCCVSGLDCYVNVQVLYGWLDFGVMDFYEVGVYYW